MSEKALGEAGAAIGQMFGGEYYRGPRQYQTKVRNAQEAHEAIRPTEFALAPEQLRGQLDAHELRLYDLIWRRTIASQMADARLLRTNVEITATGTKGEPCVFTASGKAIEFAGVPARLRRKQRRSLERTGGSGIDSSQVRVRRSRRCAW